jgi:excisionase family DNA binding protein
MNGIILQITPDEFKAKIAEVFEEKFREIVLKSPESQYLNYREVCEMTKLTRATVFKYVKAGKLPVCKVGSKRLFKLSDVTNFVENRTEPNNQNDNK